MALSDIRHIRELDLDWVDIPKNGSSTIRKALADAGFCTRPVHRIPENVYKIKGFAMVREPIDRVQSLYCMWRNNHDQLFETAHDFDWWVQHWLADRWDEQTVSIPQSDFLQIDGINLNCQLFAWNFKDLFDFLGLTVYGHENASVRESIDISRKTFDILEDIYAEDIDLWQNLKGRA